MENEKRLIDANALLKIYKKWLPQLTDPEDAGDRRGVETCIAVLEDAPTVDAVELPKGRPGDYLEWDNGTGIKQIYCIHAVMICEDCIRYDLEKFSPVVDHPGIVRIMSIEEAEKEWREMCAKAMPREEPTLTAVFGERKDND